MKIQLEAKIVKAIALMQLSVALFFRRMCFQKSLESNREKRLHFFEMKFQV